MNALDYLLKANLYGLLFVGCYWLFLRRHTFFSLNRAYLLLSVVLSLGLPLMHLPTKAVETLPLPVGVIALPTVIVQQSAGAVSEAAAVVPTDAAVVPIPAGTPIDWAQAGWLAYGLIALVLLGLLVVRLVRLGWLIWQSPRHRMGGYVLVQPNDSTIPTFSFFGFVVINPADVDNDLILHHELVHVRQRHSTDVVALATLQAVFWAVPTLWLTDRLLRQVHEFLADKQSQVPADYARFLVEYSFGLQPSTLTNGFFNPSLLKARIIMLHKRATTRWALGKYVLVLPLAFGLLAMTTAREQITAVVTQEIDEGITVSGRVTSAADGKPLPGAMVIIANTGKGTPTDTQGQYQLQNVPKAAMLSVSFVGFTTQVIPVEGHEAIHVTLESTPPTELPTMRATKAYKSIQLNPAMPVRTPPSSETINGKVYTAVEEPAVFPTGIPGLMQYVATSLRYPAQARAAGVEGKVFVKFVVLPTGAVGSATVQKGIGSGCDEEALRIVNQMPHWKPAIQNGKPVATQFVLPIQFDLEKKEDKRTGQVTPTIQGNTGQKISTVVDSARLGRYGLLGLKGKPLFLLNGKTELASLDAIDPEDIERMEVWLNPKMQVIYGPKAADGVVSFYVKGMWEQDPELIRKTFLGIVSNPAKETDFTINQKKATEYDVEKLRIEDIRAIDWHKGDAPERRFDIVRILHEKEMTTLPYLLTSSLYLLLFYGCYGLFLRRNTFFGLNRAYLLASVVLSLLLPLLELPTETTNPLPVGTITLPAFTIGTATTTQPNSLTTVQWVWLVYGLGVGVMLIRLGVNLWAVFRLIRRGTAEHRLAFTLIRLPDDSTPGARTPEARMPSFSFGRYLVLNRADSLTEPAALIRHEAAHIRQFHTADVLFLEVVQAAFWFNPVVLFYKRSLQIVHEFLADRAAVYQLEERQEPVNRPAYARQLVAYAMDVPLTALTTPFVSKSTLKQRIVMLQKPQTHRRALLGYALALPLAALLVMCTQPEKDQPVSETAIAVEKNEARQSGNIDGPVFTVVEQQPEFKGGMAALGQYLQSNLKYPAAAKKAKVQGRVFVNFIISKTGEVSDVKILKDVGFGTGEEAVRVMQNMPRWEPGRQSGKLVNVRFNLPINFELEPGSVEAKSKVDFRKQFTNFVVNGKNVSYEEYQNAEKQYETGKYGIEGWNDQATKTAYLKLTPLKK